MRGLHRSVDIMCSVSGCLARFHLFSLFLLVLLVLPVGGFGVASRGGGGGGLRFLLLLSLLSFLFLPFSTARLGSACLAASRTQGLRAFL